MKGHEHGLLLVDKQRGGTSHDVVQQARRLLKDKHIGHCGTLDPAATGLLLLTVGRATRLTRFLIHAPKVYEGTIRFGAATDTYDAEGKVVSEGSTRDLTRERIVTEMRTFEGIYEQQAPAYSAKKIKGVKFYELARRGEEVPEEKKAVNIFELSATGDLVEDQIGFRLGCSSGTYARSVAHDLGSRLGCGAHLTALNRLAVGDFRVEHALSLAALAGKIESDEPLGSAWIPFDEIPLPFAEVTIDPQQEERVRNGQTVLVRDLSGEEGDWVKLSNRRRQFVAVGTIAERIGGGAGVVQPKVVFR